MTEPITGAHEAEVVTAARGIREANALLQQGWRIISTSVNPEQVRTGARRRLTIWMPIFILGRRIDRESDEGDDMLRERATEAGEDALAEGLPVVEQTAGEDEREDAEPIPESVPTPVPAASRAGGRPRTARRGVGDFQVTGIPGD